MLFYWLCVICILWVRCESPPPGPVDPIPPSFSPTPVPSAGRPTPFPFFVFTRQPTKPTASDLDNDTNSAASKLPYSMYYLTFPVPSLAEDVKSMPNETVLTALLSTDDSPFVPFHLPRPMVVFNKRVFDVFVGANGNIHLSKHQPCDTFNLFGDASCHLNNSYYAAFGFITDLYPRGSGKTKNIVVFNTSDAVTVAYRDINYYSSRLAVSFRISIYVDHHIEIAFDKLQRSSTFPLRDLTVLGLRPPKGDPTTFISEVDRVRGLVDWRTRVKGIYPEYQYFREGFKHIFCPISANWCADPYALNFTYYKTQLAPSSMVKASEIEAFFNLTFTSVALSCMEKLQFSLYFSWTDKSPLPSSTDIFSIGFNDTLPCAVASATQLTCNIYHPSILTYAEKELKSNSSVPIYFRILWKPAYFYPNVTYQTRMFPFDPIEVTFFSKALESVSSLQPSTTNIRHEEILTPNTTVSYCADEAVCSNNYTCLSNGVASCYRPSVPDSLFSTPNCLGKCYEDYASYDQYEDYVSDSTGRCCRIEDLDCAGFCFGNNTLALNNVDRSTYCCPKGFKIDCAGICEGNTKYDACNVCGGSDASGVTCFNFTKLQIFTSGSDKNNFYPTFTINTADNSWFVSNQTIYIINDTPSDFVFTLSMASEPLFAPSVTYSKQSFKVKSGNRTSVSVLVSLQELLQTNSIVTKWKVKSVILSYARAGYEFKFTRNMMIYPTVENCEVVKNLNLCIGLPGCMYCLAYSGMLVVDSGSSNYFQQSSQVQRRRLMVRTNEAEHGQSYHKDENKILQTEESLDWESEVFEGGLTRSLFNNFVPNPYTNRQRTIHGHCVDGWVQEDCQDNPNIQAILASRASSSQHGTTSSVLLVSLLVMIFSYFVYF